jgi:hypothetical protein
VNEWEMVWRCSRDFNTQTPAKTLKPLMSMNWVSTKRQEMMEGDVQFLPLMVLRDKEPEKSTLQMRVALL